MRRIFGVDHETTGIMEKLTRPDPDLFDPNDITDVYVSFGWTKAIKLPFIVHGPWCSVSQYPGNYWIKDIQNWLVEKATGHWYYHFEVQGKYSRLNNSHLGRAEILFENRNDAMLCKLTNDFTIPDIPF